MIFYTFAFTGTGGFSTLKEHLRIPTIAIVAKYSYNSFNMGIYEIFFFSFLKVQRKLLYLEKNLITCNTSWYKGDPNRCPR